MTAEGLLDEVLGWSRRRLHQAMAASHGFDLEALGDTEYDGISLGLPRWAEKLTWKKFTKAFCADDDGLRGWNVAVEQDGLDRPWTPRLRAGERITYGHFRVVSAASCRLPGPYHHGALLDYCTGGNRRRDPMGWIQDPLVSLLPGSADLLLGYSFACVGPLRLDTPTYFVLRRNGPLTRRVDPPRAPVLDAGRRIAS